MLIHIYFFLIITNVISFNCYKRLTIKKLSKFYHYKQIKLQLSSKSNDLFDDLYDSNASKSKKKADYNLEYDRKLNELLEIIENKSKLDHYASSKLHMDTIHSLIRSDTIHRIDIDIDGDNHQPTVNIPTSYIKTILTIQKIIQMISNNHPCYTLIKLILKKESLQQTIATSFNDLSSIYISVRDLIELERKVERSFSLILLVILTYRENIKQSNKSKELNESFLYFSKLLLERIPIHERHLSMLLLCRGILSYGYNYNSNKNKLDVQGLFYNSKSLKDTFLCGMRAHGILNPNSSYRMLYPFAALLLRSFANSNIYPRNQNHHILIQNEMNQHSFDGSMEEWMLCKFLSTCYHYTKNQSNPIEDVKEEEEDRGFNSYELVDDAINVLRRWIIDLIGIHFINEDSNLYGPLHTRISIPEILRTNTVAMELLTTDNAFVEGIKKDRQRYAHAVIELGRYLNIICSMAIEENTYDSLPLSPPLLISSTLPGGIELHDEISVIGNIKKFMSIISVMKWLPSTNLIRKQLEIRFQLRKLLIKQEYIIISQIPSRKLIDEDLFYDKNNSKDKVMEDIDSIYNPINKDLLYHQNKDIKNNIHTLLLYTLNELLQVKNMEVFNQENVSEEIHIIFNTWRRPHILLEYYKMHYKNEAIRSLYLRFLKALFGISNETFDDIRYLDVKNRYHLNRFDPVLMNTWIHGKTSSGEWLPGFNDPETILMIGEDTNTCMTIRPRQKGTNRGLLSILLHGSCRILGIKDNAGKLLSRAIARLLIDEKTSRPILYIDNPYGTAENNNHLDIYDQAGQLGRLLQIPVIYSKPPPLDEYSYNEYEASAIQYEVQVDSSPYHQMEDISSSRIPFCDLKEYSKLSPYIWVNGLYDEQTQSYISPYLPKLISPHQNTNQTRPIQFNINRLSENNDNLLVSSSDNPTTTPSFQSPLAIDTSSDITGSSAIEGVRMGVRPIALFQTLPAALTHQLKEAYHYIDSSPSFSKHHSIANPLSSSSLSSSSSSKQQQEVNEAVMIQRRDDEIYFDSIESTSSKTTTIRNNRRTFKPSGNNNLNNIPNKNSPPSEQSFNLPYNLKDSLENSNKNVEMPDESSKELLIIAASKKRHSKSMQYQQFERKKILEQENLLKYNQRCNIKQANNNTIVTTATTNNNNKVIDKKLIANNIKNRDIHDEDEFFYPIFDE